MARKLTPEELRQAQGDFDLLPTLQNKKGKKAAADDKPAEKKRGRGHQSPWGEGVELQRVNVFLPVQTARLVKAAAVMRGVDLGVLLDELIRDHISLSSL